MRIIDSGHEYAVRQYDSMIFDNDLIIFFMKRIGDGYPYNEGLPHSGTNCQELIRVLIDRVKYLNRQISCWHNKIIIILLRFILFLFEIRANKRHNIKIDFFFYYWHFYKIEELYTCKICGHIRCKH